jgi:hypothetical protein
MTEAVIERLPEDTSFKHLTYKKQYHKLDRMTQEEREEHRKEQLRNAQRRYRESHGLIKPQLSIEEKLKTKKEKAHERYLKRKEATSGEPKVDKIPESYTIEYQRQYHKNYYNENKDRLLTRCKEYYHKKKEEKTD